MALSIKNKKIVDFLTLTFGAILLGFAIQLFYASNNIVTGGLSGFAIVVRHYSDVLFGTPIPLWLTNLVLNIPLFLIGAKLKGFSFLAKTIYATFLLSFALYISSSMNPIHTDLIISAIYGGILTGVGTGLVLRGMATTGGTDLAAVIIHVFVKHIHVSRIMFYLDSIVVVLGLFVFGYEKAMYAIISIYISSKSIELILEGMHFSKAVFIISEQSEAIAQQIISQLERGVTGLAGHGMYTNQDKNVLLVVVSIKEMIALKELVNKIDKNSFVIVADVREVLGEGFKAFG